ncbi:carboxymuconolactone decarboxylase family protein [Aneurinibacillus sp. Ricciae_BoGa-3]|uniref:carboxymuconolactone decarboxylase family protein n=1 Tax=Aneurinibacillus sp. Ricciae_BoGa-3 TaxID=3022697 RepID=UPI0023419BC9|nr:carboxymuconolactone decarboxylase family protein [Aneurinibacillus sp. Ricciae_BoGa-3]WCK53997.1 carboxymuconolactone decarboxylase family protein [Aneurinibacillus sp. Ricciae_BoGa-3]
MNNYRDAVQDYRQSVGNFEEISPDFTQAYNDFTGMCFKDGTISEKDKHLIALGISLASQNEYCILYHTLEALHKGAKEQEIYETLQVTAALRGGSAFSQITLVQNALAEFDNTVH